MLEPHCRTPFSLSVVSGLILMLFVSATVQSASAQACGDIITADVTLTSDIGPCPGNALALDGIQAHVTIDLNGHTIRGRGTGNAVTIGAAFPGVTIKGPGKILNFAIGITAGGAAPDLLVYDVTFQSNGEGIGVSGASAASIRILNNTFFGAQNGVTAISADNEGTVYIYQNVINGFSGAGVNILGETSVTVDENLIKLNQAGVVSDTFATCSVIRGNTILGNRADGIQVGFDPSAQKKKKKVQSAAVTTSTCNDIEDNTVISNGGNGIFIAGGDYSPIVQNNMVFSNVGNGISIVGGDLSTLPIQVLGNRISNNGTDLFWDGNGNGFCWKQNIFGTSSPAALPPCS